MSVLSRFNQPRDAVAEDGRSLYWHNLPGRGVPLRHDGPAPILYQEERDKLVRQGEFKAALFRTWEPAEVEAYARVMNKCLAGEYRLRRQLDSFDAPSGGWRFWVEWIEQFFVVPPDVAKEAAGA